MGQPSHAAIVRVHGLFVASLPALRGFVTALVGDYALVDDVIQETFITVTAKADSFEPGTNFRAWAWTIARHKALQALRARSRRHHLSEAALEALCAQDESLQWEKLERWEKHLEACLAELAPKARMAVDLRYKHAHRVAEIARRMGWTINAVHVALTRARRVLRACVEQRLSEEGPGWKGGG